jgi:hypothetical protein
MTTMFTPKEQKDLRWLLEAVIADQEHFLDDETDPGARREATRTKRRAEKLLARLDSLVAIRVVSKRDADGDSEIRLVPVRTTSRRRSGTPESVSRTIPNLATLLNCAEADLLGLLESIDVSAQDKEYSAAQTVRELHAALTRLQPQHTCPLSKWGGAP